VIRLSKRKEEFELGIQQLLQLQVGLRLIIKLIKIILSRMHEVLMVLGFECQTEQYLFLLGIMSIQIQQ